MKSALLLSVPFLALSLFSDVVETNQGTYLELFTKRGSTEIVAKVPVSKGKIETKNCYRDRSNETWCRVYYTSADIEISGYSNKKYIDTIMTKPKQKERFEVKFGGRYDEEAKDIIVLDDGYLAVGYTESFGAGNEDVYLVKTDKFGNKLFSRAYGGADSDIANSVLHVKGSFMLAGSTKSFGNRVQNMYVSRVRENGELVWQKGLYSDKDDYYDAQSITKVREDNFLVVGNEDHVKFFNSEKNIYVNAVDIKGKRNGIKYYGGKKSERAYSAITVSDGYVIAGETDTWGHGDYDAYVLKIDKSGKRVWHNAFGMKYDERASQIIATKEGGYILIGTSDSNRHKREDMFVVKITADGKREWQYLYGTKEKDEGFGIVEVEDGYVLAGTTEDTKTYTKDAFLIKIDKKGDVLWNKKYGSSRDDAALAIKKDGSFLVVAGYTTSISNYKKDLYIFKTDLDGNIR